MLRTSLLITLLTVLTPKTRTAYVTEQPTFANRLEKLYEKLEHLTIAPIDAPAHRELGPSPLEKLEILNSLTPDKFDAERLELNEDDEELLATMQMWGKLNPEQMEDLARELQRIKVEHDYEKSDRLEGEWNDGDGDWVDEEEYSTMMMDGSEGSDDWDDESSQGQTHLTIQIPNVVTPSAFTKLDPEDRQLVVSSPAEQLALTNQRPRVIIYDSLPPGKVKDNLKNAIIDNLRTVMHASKCMTPQPRWFQVRQLAPAADTVYMPTCVLLHRCAPDAGCCLVEGEVCAPVEGKHVSLPFFLQKAQYNDLIESRIVFFNHTRCACVSTRTLQKPVNLDEATQQNYQIPEITANNLKENEWQPSTEEPRLERDEETLETTTTSQLRRCTCPILFMAQSTDNGCTCVCDWKDASKRRDCTMLARGKEHFGMRDRYCIDKGQCNLPSCEYGVYKRRSGQCPMRKIRRSRFHIGRNNYYN